MTLGGPEVLPALGISPIAFRHTATEHVFDGVDSAAARRACPRELWPVARRKLDQINRVTDVRHLPVPPGNRLERLTGDRNGQHSIRINQQYRNCFRWEAGHAYEVEITDYHRIAWWPA